jgi:hypothetical protein
MNPEFFNKSAMGTAWEAQKQQPFGKDNILQVYIRGHRNQPETENMRSYSGDFF